MWRLEVEVGQGGLFKVLLWHQAHLSWQPPKSFSEGNLSQMQMISIRLSETMQESV